MIPRFTEIDQSQLTCPVGTIRFLPIPYDLTTSYCPGARFAPDAIFAASPQIEMFDHELKWDATQHVKFLVEDKLEQNTASAADMMQDVYLKAQTLLKTGDFLFALGGEHSLTAPLVQAHLDKYPKLHVVQIDAHCDLRQTWNGSPHSHACCARRMYESGATLTQIGIRNMSEEEFLFLQTKPQGISVWESRQIQSVQGWDNLMKHLSQNLPSPVYLTVDVDGLDPSVIPATGTPEPGGLSWHQCLSILETVVQNTQVIGADVMELSPIPQLEYANFATAKLCYKIASLVFHQIWGSQTI